MTHQNFILLNDNWLIVSVYILFLKFAKLKK